MVRNVVVHHWADGLTFTGDRLAEVDHRWLDRMLAADQRRFAGPLSAPRPQAGRVVGCCRDFTLLTVAALRRRGVPARSRVGFAAYFAPDFHYDHVVVEYHDGDRWRWADAMLEPGEDRDFDPLDIPRPRFESAADVWTGYRRGTLDVDRYGVGPDRPERGPWFAHKSVLTELAHRQRDELLLWDTWGAMARPGADPDDGLVDEVAALLLAADGGDPAAEAELSARYAADPRLHPDGRVVCHSPTGTTAVVDLD